MRIRFLTVLDSGVEGFPFMPGQVIEVAKPSPWLLSYLDGERAIRLPDEEEIALVPEPERAVDVAAVEVPESAAPIEAAVTRKGKGRRK